MSKSPFDEEFKVDYYSKRNRSRPVREHSIFHLKGYSEDLEKPYPSWYYESVKSLKGICVYCSSELPKNKRRYCNDICKHNAAGAPHELQGTSVRKFIHKLYDFKCCGCAAYAQIVTPAGARIPILKFDVDHKIPLHKGGVDEVTNLQLLCSDCHKKKTREDMK